MKAVRINQWGQPARVEDVSRPVAADGQVLVKVHAASVNPIDIAIAAGHLKGMMAPPVTLGTDFAGEVVAVGAGVQRVKPGDAVYGMSLSRGAFAEFAAVPGNGVAHRPRTLDDTQAAAVPLAALTAWQTLFDLAKLQSGERVLIHGAGGNIGAYAVQLAKNAGATVFASDKEDKQAFLEDLGADRFISAGERFEDVVGKVDVVLDLVGGELMERSFNVLKQGGRYVTPAGKPSQEEAARRGIQVFSTFTQPTVAELDLLAKEIDAGKLKVNVLRTFPLEQAQAAMDFFRETAEPGRVVITIP